MLPRLGNKFGFDIEVISKPRPEYQSAAYAALGLPKAPAIMIDGEVIIEGRDIDEQQLEGIIRGRLGNGTPVGR